MDINVNTIVSIVFMEKVLIVLISPNNVLVSMKQ